MNHCTSVAELQREHITLELECIDRMPQLTSAPGVAAYFGYYKGQRFASTKDAVAIHTPASSASGARLQNRSGPLWQIVHHS
jgi:hypothetical protein